MGDNFIEAATHVIVNVSTEDMNLLTLKTCNRPVGYVGAKAPMFSFTPLRVIRSGPQGGNGEHWRGGVLQIEQGGSVSQEFALHRMQNAQAEHFDLVQRGSSGEDDPHRLLIV